METLNTTAHVVNLTMQSDTMLNTMLKSDWLGLGFNVTAAQVGAVLTGDEVSTLCVAWDAHLTRDPRADEVKQPIVAALQARLAVKVIVAEDLRNKRTRVRGVSIDADAIGRTATAEKRWVYRAQHGGSVPNSYGYRATTDTVVGVASPDGVVVLWYGTLPANKVTLAGVGGDLWDKRMGAERKEVARMAWQARHAEAVRKAWNSLHPSTANS
jgi:hypothetical protein